MRSGKRPGPGLRMETRLAVVGRGGSEPGQPLNVPIVPASNFRAAPSGTAGREYSRDDGTPGWEALEELIGDLEARHPGLKDRLIDKGALRRFVNVYLNDEDVRFLGGLDTPVADGDTVTVLPAVAGGSR